MSLAANCDGDQTFSVATDCRYGLYHGTLLHYFAKAIHMTDLDQLDDVARTKSSRLDLLPTIKNGKLTVGISWIGQPLDGATVSVVDPAGAPFDLTTDAQGTVTIERLQAGLYCLRTNRDDKSDDGEIGGESYRGATYYSTLTIRIPAFAAAVAAEPTSGETAKAATDADGYCPLPQPISSFGAAVIGDWLYVYGGHTGRAHAHSRDNLARHFGRINLVEKSEWQPLPMETPLQGLPLVAHGKYVYRMGGLSALNAAGEEEELRSVAEFARFDTTTQAWERLPDLPESRSSHDAVVVGDKIYVIGGWTLNADDEEEWLTTGLVVDLTEDPLHWERFDVPNERRALAVGTNDGRIYAVGGISPFGDIDRSLDIYNPATGEWTTGPELPGTGIDGFGASAWQVNGRLIVSGMNGKIMSLNQDGTAWEQVGSLKLGRFFHRLLSVRGEASLIAVAGASMQGHLDDIEFVSVEF